MTADSDAPVGGLPIGPADLSGPVGPCPRCKIPHGPDDPRLCADCGHVHDPNPKRCPKHGKDPDGVRRPCRKYRRKNAPVCETHGADAPQVRAAAVQRTEVEAVERAISRLPRQVRQVDNPLETIRDYAGEVLGWYDLAASKAKALEEWTVGENAIPRGELVLLQRFMAEARQTLDAVGKLNLEERMARMVDVRAARFAEVVRLLVAGLDLTPEQQARVPAALAAAIGSLTDAPVIDGVAS